MKTKLLFWLCGGILSVASPAFALEAGQCLPAAEMQAALKADGQVPVVTGNRVTLRKDRPQNIFTSNADGFGYELEGDQPRGTPSKTVCVMSRYHGLRLNDITSPLVPGWALMGNNQKAADDNCAATKAGLCESYDDYVKRGAPMGLRVMLVARVDLPNPDGTRRNGRLLTVLTWVGKNLADVKATNSLGASESVGGLEDVNYTPFAGNFLAKAAP